MLIEFRTSGDRTRFLDWLQINAAELAKFAKAASSQSTVVIVRGGDPKIEDRMADIARSIGEVRVSGDVQMRVFG